MVSYVVGSLNFAIIISRLFSLPDPRTVGSNNPGATNLNRYAGKWLASLCLALDACKGLLAVSLVSILNNLDHVLELQITAAACCVLGHCFSIFHLFRGGKGVATSIGALFAISIIAGFMIILLWLMGYFLFKKSYKAALFSFTLFPGMITCYALIMKSSMPIEIFSSLLLMIFMYFTHFKNIFSSFNNNA
ncbi:MAG: glycerol-3-phosphate acyltransferase [Methylacidiphilales bacterium]|nr:glycerol-3-phosphate acyltransferase [Candidatus Methylacidiphilales bacterium]